MKIKPFSGNTSDGSTILDAASDRSTTNYVKFGEWPTGYIKYAVPLPTQGFTVDLKNVTFEANKQDIEMYEK